MDENIARIQTVLGEKYEIKHQMSEGAMGKIFLGVDKLLERKVAIKIVRQKYFENEEVKKRFFQEAKLAAGLEHSGIIDIIEFGTNKNFD